MFKVAFVAGLLAAGSALAGSDHGHGKHSSPAVDDTQQQQLRTAEGIGTVQSIAQDGSSVMLAHGPIAELRWPAMTMEMTLADPALAERIGIEDRVRFVLRQTGETDYEIVSLEPVD
ncbi:copper-binding protein [Halomonas sp. MCCC 1A17488]|uniref:Copper-binding protein n=1 Tax=Billgrantia sulfidoxydans TaxID=2733484 RepID=A0ABX7W3T2_9GAMM|nr:MULTISPECIES: copper-binding protein [Halomonas]MCE8015978.1 copper-binding protein [Halomonas sp. MCCC 1A17488]MCG3239311.1 copper-binding protein [Halomonas sp. MCCC 1A17488]QPP50757.1 copper-binding protein [Halomonas sp. SS10-MC5]QTP54332.1 copper-binding protein [Halomonas sulfidoxydans]